MNWLRECEFCTNEAAAACVDGTCRAAGLGEPHADTCPAADTGDMGRCDCIPEWIEL